MHFVTSTILQFYQTWFYSLNQKTVFWGMERSCRDPNLVSPVGWQRRLCCYSKKKKACFQLPNCWGIIVQVAWAFSYSRLTKAVMNEMLITAETEKISIVVPLGISAAFDTSNNLTLLEHPKLWVGVTGSAFKWLSSCLTELIVWSWLVGFL